MKTSIVVDISSPVPYLAKYWVSSYGPKCCRLVKLHDSLKCNISRNKLMMNFIFGVKINITFFYKLILLFWVFGTRHAPKYPKISLIILRYLQKRMKKSNISWNWLFCHSQACTKDPKQQVYNIFAKSQGKLEGWSWLSFYMCVVGHAKITQNRKFTILCN